MLSFTIFFMSIYMYVYVCTYNTEQENVFMFWYKFLKTMEQS